MSVVAVKIEDGMVYMAADSQVGYGETKVMRRRSLGDDKLWSTTGGLLVGFVGTSALGSILRRWTMRETPCGPDEAGITAWVDGFHEWRREKFQDGGEVDHMSFIVAFKGRAWVVDGYSVSEVPPVENYGYMAIGAGMDLALGAMAFGADTFTAVSIACDHNEQCGGEVVHARMLRDGVIQGDVARLDVVSSAEHVEASGDLHIGSNGSELSKAVNAVQEISY